MLTMIVLLAVGAAIVLFVPGAREWLVERMKKATDTAIVSFLRATSSFGKELTEEGRAEQKLWREQRLRNLKRQAKSDASAPGREV